ncbi:hypothetical protein LVD15_24875 [Fulvivirga maritima]|uniref:hypothetical protein n=1 Tax=Fulvivirga maritima TaxID=2904247 RepID=UPI001F396DAD|nr:hypothetical protein [Fulvivirga maritima]UII26491.1 hypothetical protein LVD15_24875 [Fulvivirga maritima]
MKYITPFLLLLMTSCSQEFILRPKVEGQILDSANKDPLKGVKVEFIDCFQSDCNGEKPSFTDKDGVFSIKEESKDYFLFKPHRDTRPYYSFMLLISHKDYVSDTIDIREYQQYSEVIILDSINLVRKGGSK